MINVLFFVTYCLSQIIEVSFNENSLWMEEFKNSSNNTFRIIPNDQVQQYYQIDVKLDMINPQFMLLAEKNQAISNPYSPLLINGKNIDATNQYENRKIRFLKITSKDQNIYVTILGNIEGEKYVVSIFKTNSPNICQNNCSDNGFCEEQGCSCSTNYTGVDCTTHATPIIDKVTINKSQQFDKDYLIFYLPLESLNSQQLILKFKTNNYGGLQIVVYKTLAIINPFEQLIYNPNLCEIFQVSKNKDLELLLILPQTLEQSLRINFAIMTISPNFKLEDLEISLEEYKKEEIDSISSDITIIISVTIGGVVFLTLIIMFWCCYRRYKRQQALRNRMMMQNQEILHSAHENHPITHQQIQLEEACQKNCLLLLSSKEINPEEYCSICLELLKSSLEVRQTRCHHNFHSQCINLWLEKAKHECPICRQQLEFKTQNEMIRI